MNESSDEWTQVFESKGILVIILWDMISNDLVNWGLLIAFVSTGFGVAYTILQPNRSNYCRSSRSSKAVRYPRLPSQGARRAGDDSFLRAVLGPARRLLHRRGVRAEPAVGRRRAEV